MKFSQLVLIKKQWRPYNELSFENVIEYTIFAEIIYDLITSVSTVYVRNVVW